MKSSLAMMIATCMLHTWQNLHPHGRCNACSKQLGSGIYQLGARPASKASASVLANSNQVSSPSPTLLDCRRHSPLHTVPWVRTL